jgi:hypothetical protein
MCTGYKAQKHFFIFFIFVILTGPGKQELLYGQILKLGRVEGNTCLTHQTHKIDPDNQYPIEVKQEPPGRLAYWGPAP